MYNYLNALKPFFFRKALCFCAVFFSFTSFSQKEENFWIVDNNYALDFNHGIDPIVVNQKFGDFYFFDNFMTYSSISSICDKKGNLLFYTDGNFVWNKDRQIMPNGTLAGHNVILDVSYDMKARALILPDPNIDSQYYLIVNDHVRKVNTYTIVDISLNNGKGDVVRNKKLIPFTKGKYFSDLRATGADSCRGIWIVGSTNDIKKKLFAFKLGVNGIDSLNPIISNIDDDIFDFYFSSFLSKNGKYYPFICSNASGFHISVYKFNKKTGRYLFDPEYKINNSFLSTSNYNFNLYTCTKMFFSNNDNNLHVYLYDFSNQGGWYNVDLINQNTSKTATFINVYGSDVGVIYYPSHGPNGKLYKPIFNYVNTGLTYPLNKRITSHNLAVINNPDGVGTNVGYDFNGITFPGDAFPRVPYQGLVNYYGRPKPRPRITLPTQQICTQTPFSLSADVSNLPQVQSGKQIWYLNDTEVISYNPNDQYTIQEPGVYKLSFRHEECIEHTTITVTAPPVHNIPPKDSLCEGKFLQLTSTGILQIKNSANLPILSPVSVAGNYTFTVLGCSSLSGSFGLKVTGKPNLTLPNTLAGCLPLGVQLQPLFITSLGQNLLWSNGSTIPYQTITTSGIFTITVSNRCFTEQKSTQISLLSKPILPKFAPDTTVCEGKNITILGNQNLQATEQSSNKTYFSNNNILLLTQAGIYTISQSNTCHTSTGVLGISEILKPNLTLPNILAGCLPLGVQLQPVFNSTLGQNLLWSNGSTIPYQTITTSGIFTITVSNRCFAEQKSTQITLLSKPILPKFAPDTTICEGKNITILGNQNMVATEQSSNKTYFSNNNILLLTQAGIYTISQSNVCHTSTSNIVIKTDNFPIFTVPKDTVICDSTSFSFAAIRNKNANTSIIWKDGSTENYRSISQAGNYEITVKNTCGEFKKAFNITFSSSKIGFKNTNIFTPNGDNSNDEWQPTTESSEAYKLEIFNRQGTKVFQSEQWNESWQAQSQPDGIYFYHISYLDCNQQTKSLKGWVEVRR
ncbi:MAG: gliding motility-associated C-terminal domain-containing protein [Cytophagales bacterium]|nr:MAG: gliding motility-associated C-terminal domain-containing protein [Cytophagales bacterium]